MASNPRPQTGSAPGLLGAAGLPVILILAAMAVGVAALLPLVQSSGVTSTAGSIRTLEREKQDWQALLREKEVDVARLGSLERIEREAANRLQMVKPEDVRYITVDAPAPEPHRLPGRFLPPAADQPDAGSSLVDDLFGWLPLD